MPTQTTPWTLLDDMFSTLASQENQKAQMANSALSSGAGYYQKKDYSRASSEFKRAISLDPTNTQSYNLLATTYLAQKKPEEAIKAYKNSLSLDPTQDKVFTNLGNIYLQQKKFNLAEKAFKDASRVNPTDTVPPYTLGQLYLQTERYGEAEVQFKKVSKMAPYDPNPYYSLGLTYNKEGKSAEAVKQLTQAVKLRPKMAPAHLELGIAYAALGDTASAQKEVDILTRLDATQGELLRRTIARPKMMAAGGGEDDTFAPVNQTPSSNPQPGDNPYLLSLLDIVDLSAANSSKSFSLTFFFDSKMDAESVQDVSNWTITKASGGAAGYYNLLPIRPAEAHIPQNPMTVTYDPETQSATVNFMLSQNNGDGVTGDATIDAARMVFKFSGIDAVGRQMDTAGDQIDGAALASF